METSNPTLDTLISVIFLILMLSIFHSGIMELIQTYTRRRNHTLKKALDKAFKTPFSKSNFNLSEAIYQQPLINNIKPEERSFPAYISSEIFSEALLGVFIQNAQTGEESAKSEYDLLKDEINKLEEGDAKQILVGFLLGTSNMADFKTKASKWFDLYMERIGSQYKRKLVPISFIVSLVIAGAINADLIYIAKFYWINANERNSTVQLAQQYVTENPQQTSLNETEQINNLKNQYHYLQNHFPIGWTSDSIEVVKKDTLLSKDSIQQIRIYNKLKTSSDTSASFKNDFKNYLPLKSDTSYLVKSSVKYKKTKVALNPPKNNLFIAFIGWLLAAAAISVGSENWFNILSKLLQLRTSLKPSILSDEKKEKSSK
jgi:hypothetical protein